MVNRLVIALIRGVLCLYNLYKRAENWIIGAGFLLAAGLLLGYGTDLGPALAKRFDPELESSYQQELNAEVVFRRNCVELDSLDRQEDDCKNLRGAEEPDCIPLTRRETVLRKERTTSLHEREQARSRLPWWAPTPTAAEWRCSYGGIPHT